MWFVTILILLLTVPCNTLFAEELELKVGFKLKNNLISITKVDIVEVGATSYSTKYAAVATAKASCERVVPKSSNNLAILEKLRKNTSRLLDHRQVTVFNLVPNGPHKYYCRPDEPPVDWKFNVGEFSSGRKRDGKVFRVSVNAVSGEIKILNDQ